MQAIRANGNYEHCTKACKRMTNAGLSHLGDTACFQSQPLLSAPVSLYYFELLVSKMCILSLSTAISYFLSHLSLLVFGWWMEVVVSPQREVTWHLNQNMLLLLPLPQRFIEWFPCVRLCAK